MLRCFNCVVCRGVRAQNVGTTTVARAGANWTSTRSACAPLAPCLRITRLLVFKIIPASRRSLRSNQVEWYDSGIAV